MKNVCVIGSLNIDLVTKTDFLPKMGETVSGSGFNIFPGGKGANQAVAASRLGLNVSMIGCVGDDEFGNILQKALQCNGVDTKGVSVLRDCGSGVATIILCENDNFIILDGGANQRIITEMVEKQVHIIERSDIIMLQNEIPFLINRYIIEKYHSRARLILNTAPAIKLPSDIYPYIDILIMNEHECAFMLDHEVANVEDAISAAKAIISLGAKNVVITLGKNGAVFCDREKSGHIPAVSVVPVDTTGGGDTFCAGVATTIAKGGTLEEAVEFANFTAALAITQTGAQSAMPRYNEVVEFKKSYCKNIVDG